MSSAFLHLQHQLRSETRQLTPSIRLRSFSRHIRLYFKSTPRKKSNWSPGIMFSPPNGESRIVIYDACQKWIEAVSREPQTQNRDVVIWSAGITSGGDVRAQWAHTAEAHWAMTRWSAPSRDPLGNAPNTAPLNAFTSEPTTSLHAAVHTRPTAASITERLTGSLLLPLYSAWR